MHKALEYSTLLCRGFIDATEAEIIDCDTNMSLVVKSGAPVVRHCSFEVHGNSASRSVLKGCCAERTLVSNCVSMCCFQKLLMRVRFSLFFNKRLQSQFETNVMTMGKVN